MASRITLMGRVLVYASLLAFIAYYLVGTGWPPGVGRTALKGAAVGILALLALVEGEGRNGRMLAAVMALGALGDMAIEYRLEAGAACFLAGHLVAIAFYRRNRRERLAASQKALALAVLVAVPAIAWMLPTDRASAPLTALYALGLAAMAAAAWTSRFTRYAVGLGAMLFVASDLLIFARLGPLRNSDLPELLIWPLYYIGQYLITLGVVIVPKGHLQAVLPHRSAP